MIVNMEFQGMEQLLKNLQEVSSLDVVGQCTRHIINLSKLETHRTMKRNVPRSRDHSKTGRYLGHRFVQYSPAHAADVIPVSNTRTDTDGRSNAEVGWKLSDNSPQFYMKFVEWAHRKCAHANSLTKQTSSARACTAALPKRRYSHTQTSI